MPEEPAAEDPTPKGRVPSSLLAVASLAAGSGLILLAYGPLELDRLRSGIEWAEFGAWAVAALGGVLCIFIPAWLLLRHRHFPAGDGERDGTGRVRVLVAIGTVTGIAAIAQFAYFLWPGAEIRRDARLDEFESSLEDYGDALAVADSTSGTDLAETEGYIAGRVIVVRSADGDEPDYDEDALVDEGLAEGDESAAGVPGDRPPDGEAQEPELDNLYFDLPERLQASEPEEVGTLVAIDWGHSIEETYEDGSVSVRTLTRLSLIDLDTGTLVGLKTIEGPDPDAPETRTCVGSGGCDNVLGGLPDEEIVDYLESLPQESAG